MKRIVNPDREQSSLANIDGDFIPPCSRNILSCRQESAAFSNRVNIAKILLISIFIFSWPNMILAQTGQNVLSNESRVVDGIKATLKVTASQNMIDLILSDAKTGKSITNAKVSAFMKGPDGKVLEKELMGMKMGEEFSFMNTLDMSRKGSYSFDITVEVEKKLAPEGFNQGKVKFNFVYEVK